MHIMELVMYVHGWPVRAKTTTPERDGVFAFAKRTRQSGKEKE